MAGKIALGIPCEVCGTDQWYDNRQDKKHPKAPDYKCSGTGCKEESGYPVGRWEKNRAAWGKPKQGAPVAAAVPPGAPKGGRLTGDDTTPDERGQRVFTWEAYCHTYAVLTKQVVRAMYSAGLGDKVEIAPGQFRIVLDASAVQAGVATLLIQGDRNHTPLLNPRKVAKDEVAKPAKAPVPEHIEADFEDDDGSQPWP